MIQYGNPNYYISTAIMYNLGQQISKFMRDENKCCSAQVVLKFTEQERIARTSIYIFLFSSLWRDYDKDTQNV
jgi:hypothetical protein